MYVYIKSEPGLWTVGHYAPDGAWMPESDQLTTEEAANRVAWLNGGHKEAYGKYYDCHSIRRSERRRPTHSCNYAKCKQ